MSSTTTSLEQYSRLTERTFSKPLRPSHFGEAYFLSQKTWSHNSQMYIWIEHFQPAQCVWYWEKIIFVEVFLCKLPIALILSMNFPVDCLLIITHLCSSPHLSPQLLHLLPHHVFHEMVGGEGRERNYCIPLICLRMSIITKQKFLQKNQTIIWGQTWLLGESFKQLFSFISMNNL